MPFEEYKDENGETKTRYVAPEGTISKEPKEGFQEGGDFDLGASVGRTFGQAVPAGGRTSRTPITDVNRKVERTAWSPKELNMTARVDALMVS